MFNLLEGYKPSFQIKELVAFKVVLKKNSDCYACFSKEWNQFFEENNSNPHA